MKVVGGVTGLGARRRGYAAAVTPATPPWLPRRRAVRSAVLGGGVVVICWLACAAVAGLRERPGVPVDSAVRAVLEPLRAVPVVGAGAEMLAVIGEQPVSVLVAVVLGIAVAARWRLPAGLAFGLASLVSAGQVILMKTVVHRPGPVIAFYEGLGSFPSGHAANAAVIATIAGLLVRRPWAWAAGVVYVVLVAASRVVLGAHWFTDTVVGAAEGGGTALLVWAAWSLVRRPEGSPRG